MEPGKESGLEELEKKYSKFDRSDKNDNEFAKDLCNKVNKHISIRLLQETKRKNSLPSIKEFNNKKLSIIRFPTLDTSQMSKIDSKEITKEYIDRGNRAINKARGEQIIIDLTGNLGGRTDVMILAAGALLPKTEGCFLFKLQNKQGKSTNIYLNEKKTLKQKKFLTVNIPYSNEENNNYRNREHIKKIAVWVDKNTCSAAELLTLSLCSISKYSETEVRVFGTPTGGFTSKNTSRSIGNMQITYPIYSIEDVFGKSYMNDPIEPDQLVETSDNDSSVLNHKEYEKNKLKEITKEWFEL